MWQWLVTLPPYYFIPTKDPTFLFSRFPTIKPAIIIQGSSVFNFLRANFRISAFRHSQNVSSLGYFSSPPNPPPNPLSTTISSIPLYSFSTSSTKFGIRRGCRPASGSWRQAKSSLAPPPVPSGGVPSWVPPLV